MKGISILKLKRIILILAIGLFIYLGFYFLPKIFRIETIEVVGQNIEITLDQNKINSNLLFFSTDKLKSQLLNENPLIGNLTINKKFPHTLIITATARTAVVFYEMQGRFIGIDREGFIVGDVLPSYKLTRFLISLPALPAGSRMTQKNIITALVFLSNLTSQLHIDSLEEIDNKFFLAKSGKTNIFITQDVDGQIIANSLQTLWEGFRIRGVMPSKIDLRFEKPVVEF